MTREQELEEKHARFVAMMRRWKILTTSGETIDDCAIIIPAREFHLEFLALSTDMRRDHGEAG